MLPLKVPMASLLRIRQSAQCVEAYFSGYSNDPKSMSLLLEQIKATADKVDANATLYYTGFDFHLFITQIPKSAGRRAFLSTSLRSLFYNYRVRHVTFWNMNAPLF